MKKSYINLLIIVLIFAVALFVDVRNDGKLKIGSFERSAKLSLGLDLQGGMQVLLEADVDPMAMTDLAGSLETARQILENRSNGLGVSEVVFQVAGDNRIVAEFPGMTNTEQVLASLKGTGMLEFVDTGDVSLPEGTQVMTDYNTASATLDDVASLPDETIYHTVLTGADLDSAGVNLENTIPVVSFKLKNEGAKIFADFTSQNVGKFLTIVLDGQVISSPRINSAITEGSGVIQGNFTIDSANALAVQLKYGALPVPLKIVEYKMIGATLGEDSLQKSLRAGMFGMALVALFMLLYYRLPGIISIVAITFYAAVTLALYKLIPVTLTLPGIAGLLLGTGAALDANILMFERLKEELYAGRTLQQAVGICWPRAWSSIRDSNIATLITSAILFYFGSSFGATIVKGFAVTLSLGVLISLFSAYFVTKTLLEISAERFKYPKFTKWFSA